MIIQQKSSPLFFLFSVAGAGLFFAVGFILVSAWQGLQNFKLSSVASPSPVPVIREENRATAPSASPLPSEPPPPVPRPLQNRVIPILMYHYVEVVTDKNDTIRQSLNILPSVFEKQVSTLLQDGYTFLTMSEVAEVLAGTRAPPSKAVALTFDDGHRDVATVVVPLLQRLQARGTVYLIPGFLGGSDFLTLDQAKFVANSGVIEIGSHTVRHTNLLFASDQVVQDEVVRSKRTLEEELGIPVVSFAYPYGGFTDRAVEAVREAGYTNAVTTVQGVTHGQGSLFTLSRLRPGNRTGESLLRFIEQQADKDRPKSLLGNDDP